MTTENLLVVDKNNNDQPLSVVAVALPTRIHYSLLAENKKTRSVLVSKLTGVLKEHFDAEPKIKRIEFNSNDYTFDVSGSYKSGREKEEFEIGLIPVTIV